MTGRRMLVWVCWAAVLNVAIASAAVQDGGNSAPGPPKPPTLTGAPIEYLTKHYQDAFVDGSGRAWFLVRRIDLNDTARNTAFEYLVCPDLPGKVIEFPATNIPLGFDAKGRFWDVTRYGLGCTDAATGEFSEHDVAPGKSPDQLAKPHPSQPDFKPGFARVMLEHSSSGRLYFIDSYGLHVLDGGTWSYQLFDPAPTKLAKRGDPVKIAECPDGTVVVWGKVGLWTHDGKSWRRHSSQPYELAPLANGQCLVMIESNSMGRVGRLNLKDGSPATVPGRDPLTTRWPSFKHILTLPRGASLINGYDTSLSRRVLTMLTPAGEAVVLPPDAELRFEYRNVPRPAPRLPDGRVVLPTKPLYTWDGQKVSPLLANPLAVSGPCFGCDKRGRILLSADDQAVSYSRLRLAVVSPRVLTAPPSLPVEMFGFVESAALGANGQVWAKFSNQAFLSRYDAGRWLHVARPGGLTKKRKYTPNRPMLLQPLAGGSLVAAMPGRGACLFDGGQWTGYASLRLLVEAHADRLRKVIDNRRARCAGSVLLSLDAGGRIWAVDVPETSPYIQSGMGVYDGHQWISLAGGVLMGPDGAKCIRQTPSGAAICDATVWPPKELSSLPNNIKRPYGFARVNFDREKRFIAQELFNGPAWRWDGKGWTKLPVPGHCVLADSAGRMWFNSRFCVLTLVDAGGCIGPKYEHAVNNKGPVVEQAPGIYWCAASDGLMQLGTANRGGKPLIVVRKHYGDLVPQGKVRQLFFDGDGGLWIVTGRLARVTVPPTPAQGRR